jgi:hypothetical protein
MTYNPKLHAVFYKNLTEELPKGGMIGWRRLDYPENKVEPQVRDKRLKLDSALITRTFSNNVNIQNVIAVAA